MRMMLGFAAKGSMKVYCLMLDSRPLDSVEPGVLSIHRAFGSLTKASATWSFTGSEINQSCCHGKLGHSQTPGHH